MRDSISLLDLKSENQFWLFGVIQLGRALSSRRADVRRSSLRILRQYPRILALLGRGVRQLLPFLPLLPLLTQ